MKISNKTLVLSRCDNAERQPPEGMEKFRFHAFLLAGPVSLKKTVRINATTIP